MELKIIVLKGGICMSDINISNINHEDFESILKIIRDKLSNNIEFDEIRSIESNFDTKGMSFKRRGHELFDGTIIIGEDDSLIAIDISKAGGEVVSFILKDKEDTDGIENVILWLRDNYI
jgi:hypothetical protein